MRISEDLTIAASQSFKEREYWMRKLAGELPPSHFPYDTGTMGISGNRRDIREFVITGNLAQTSIKLSGESDSRLHMILAAGITALLDRYTGTGDIIVGIPVLKQEIEGDFVNTVLILRNSLSPQSTFKELILQTRKTIIEATENQNYPFETLLYDLGFSGGDEKQHPFGVCVILENIHDKKYVQHADFNVIFSFKRTSGTIEGSVEYHALLYEKATIERIIDHFLRLMEQLLTEVNRPLSQARLLSGQEKQQLLFDFNRCGEAGPPPRNTIHDLFREQAGKNPDGLALVGPGAGTGQMHSITYRELNEKMSRLAVTIKEKGVKPETFVGILAVRSIEMVLGMLAILEAGGAYVPVDPEYPEERIMYMLEDSGINLALSNLSNVINRVGAVERRYAIEFIDLDAAASYGQSPSGPGNSGDGTHTAYMIYTSGSTGKPKGVVVEHRSIVNTLYWRKNHYRFDQGEVVLQLPSFSFDSSVEDIFTPLISGGRLILIEELKRLELDFLAQLITNHRVTHFLAIPHFYRTFLDTIPQSLEKMKTITVAGDHFTRELVQEHFEKLPTVRLFNEYGPTESSVCATVYEFKPGETKVSIGKPIGNVSCYILDSGMKLCPLGVPGQLCISGAGLARGYYKKPALTAEKFVENPYIPGQRMYKTGDLARWRADGNIEFFGRIDHQVKIRGIRIELGEIENCLLKHEKIKEALVMARDNKQGDKYLCAYLVMENFEKEYEAEEIARYLNRYIPEYILPSYYVKIKEIPLNPNGKIDRKKLPEPEGAARMGAEYVAPRSPLEEKLAEIWKQELNLEQVGINDNYFNIGGDSIKSIKLISIINRKLNKNLKIAELYVNNTVERLAALISKHQPDVSTVEIQYEDAQYEKALGKISNIKDKFLQRVRDNDR